MLTEIISKLCRNLIITLFEEVSFCSRFEIIVRQFWLGVDILDNRIFRKEIYSLKKILCIYYFSWYLVFTQKMWRRRMKSEDKIYLIFREFLQNLDVDVDKYNYHAQKLWMVIGIIIIVILQKLTIKEESIFDRLVLVKNVRFCLMSQVNFCCLFWIRRHGLQPVTLK